MTDFFDDPFLAANAYLDGELTAEERERAEGDPQIMAHVVELRSLQADVRAIDPPPTATRDAAIAAAMSAFASRPSPRTRDEADATASVTSSSTAPVTDRGAPDGAPIPIERRRRARLPMFLAAAAAAVVVLVAGAVVVQMNGDDDQDDVAIDARIDSSFGDQSATAERDDSLAETAVAAAPEATAESGDEAAEAEMAGGADMTEMVASDTAEDSGDQSSADAAADDGTALGTITSAPDATLEAVPSDDDVRDAVVQLVADRDAGTLPPTPETACAFGSDRLTAEILDEQLLDTGQGADLFLLGVDPVAETALAIDPDTCLIVVETPLD